MMRALTGEPAHGGDVCRFQETIEESFAVIGAPSIGDFFPALRWVDRLRGVDAALVRLQAKRDAFVTGLIDDQRRRRDAGSGRHSEKKSIIDELLSLKEIDPEYYTATIIKGIVMVSSLSPVNQSKLWHTNMVFGPSEHSCNVHGDAPADTAHCRDRHVGANHRMGNGAATDTPGRDAEGES